MDLVILGASGSIGSQTLDFLKNKKNNWVLKGFSVGNRVNVIDEIVKEFQNVNYITVKNKKDYLIYKKKYPHIKFYYGDKGLIKIILKNKNATILNALIGFVGLKPSIVSLKKDRTLLLANKESLVIGGELINKILEKKGKLIPIDSEHVAIKKCLYNENVSDIKKIIITASGGPFFNLTNEELKNVTLDEALNHPNWKMGKKITIDSATLMNKTFEIIEAHYLFPYDKKIDVLVSRDSYVHGLVIFRDKIKLNVSKPSMLGPIEYALNLGKPLGNEFNDVETNTIEKYNLLELNKKRFNVISYSDFVIKNKGNSGAILNSINETLVDSFLKGEISFIDLTQILNIIMKNSKINKRVSYYNYHKTHYRYMKITRNYIKSRRVLCK